VLDSFYSRVHGYSYGHGHGGEVAVKICIVGDAHSIHILRISDWLRAHGHVTQMVNLTPNATPQERDNAVEHFDTYVDAKRPWRGSFGYLATIFPVRKLVKELGPDVVHGHYMTTGAFFGSWSGAKVVVSSAWGSDVYGNPDDRGQRWLLRSAIKRSDVVTGDSDHILNVVKSFKRTLKTHKFLFGVQTDLFIPKPQLKPKTFTFISGRSSYPLYNPIRIVHALELIEGDSRLLLQRSKNPYPELEKVVAASPVKDRIQWYPVRDYSEMPDLFNKAHVTISIPNSDSSSAVMMESMACGVPVIASKIPQNDEWDGFGIWTPKDDSVEALAELMRKVMEQPQLIEAAGKVAREVIIQRADWDKQMEGLVKLYEELVG
jgi:glycosyltransferase involved in cell wall biosynthesis